MPRPFDTRRRALLAIGFALIAMTYLGFVVATDGVGSAVVPAVAFFVIGFSSVRFLMSRG
jgi:hypothetical protein